MVIECAPHSIRLKYKNSSPKPSLKEESNKNTDSNVKKWWFILTLSWTLCDVDQN